MSRIFSETLSAKEITVPGRLVPIEGTFDSGDRTMSFLVPSQSRLQAYVVWVDCVTAEIACDCEYFRYRVRSDSFRLEHGTYLESLAWAVNRPILPSVTRTPKGLCFHCQRVRAWLKSHKIYPHLEDIVAIHEKRLEARSA